MREWARNDVFFLLFFLLLSSVCDSDIFALFRLFGIDALVCMCVVCDCRFANQTVASCRLFCFISCKIDWNWNTLSVLKWSQKCIFICVAYTKAIFDFDWNTLRTQLHNTRMNFTSDQYSNTLAVGRACGLVLARNLPNHRDNIDDFMNFLTGLGVCESHMCYIGVCDELGNLRLSPSLTLITLAVNYANTYQIIIILYFYFDSMRLDQ